MCTIERVANYKQLINCLVIFLSLCSFVLDIVFLSRRLWDYENIKKFRLINNMPVGITSWLIPHYVPIIHYVQENLGLYTVYELFFINYENQIKKEAG